MSGGSFRYFYAKVSDWPLDPRLRKLLEDLFHDVEWAESGDYSKEETGAKLYAMVLAYLQEVTS